MYGELRERLHPDREPGFGIPEGLTELRHQMSPIPLLFDRESKMRVPPKNKLDKNSDEVCLVDLIGHSPDELDSLALAVFAMTHRNPVKVAGPAFQVPMR